MQPPLATANEKLTLKTSQTENLVTNSLLLQPGEMSEMLVQLENPGDRALRWRLEVDGDFPSQWCNWHQEDFQEIAPTQKVDISLYFQVPGDFFEELFALRGDKTRLQLNYQSQIHIYLDSVTEQQLVNYQTFNLYVRPNCSYLKFLPALYREIDFVERFLAIFEQAFDPAVQTIETFWAYLDPLTAPEALLPFLAHWVGWTLEERWDLKQQRRLIRNAITLYRWHGTRWGLRFYLHLYTGLPLDESLPESEKHIGIEEVFNDGFVLGQTIIGSDSMIGGGRPYHFIVRLRPDYADQIDERLVREIIQRQKPAFCTYELDILTPFQL